MASLCIRYSRLRGICAAVACLLLWQINVAAQLIPCNHAVVSSDYQIFLDDIVAAGDSPTSQQIRNRLEALRGFIAQRLAIELGNQAQSRRCENRYPTDISDYTDDEYESLDAMRVVLEIWGSINSGGSNTSSLGFFLVPVRPNLPPAVFVVHDQLLAANLLASFKSTSLLEAFAPIVLGARLMQNRDPRAIPLLCQGAHALGVALAGQSFHRADPLATPAAQQLLSTVRQLASDAIAEQKTAGNRSFALTQPRPDGRYTCPK